MYDEYDKPLAFSWDPTTGNLVGNGDITDGLTISLRDLTNGKMDISGTRIYNTSNGRTVWNLTRDKTGTVTFYPAGVPYRNQTGIQFVNSVDQSSYTGIAGRNAQYVAKFDFDVVLDSDNPHSFSVDYLSLTTVGARVWYNPELSGKDAYREILADGDHMEQEAAALADGFHVATLNEIITRGIGSYLMRYFYTDLKELVDEGMTDEHGNTLKTEYEVAQYIASINQDSVQLFTRGFFKLG